MAKNLPVKSSSMNWAICMGLLPAAGQDTEADVPTWLAVLVLDDDDLSPERKDLKLVPTIGVLGGVMLAS